MKKPASVTPAWTLPAPKGLGYRLGVRAWRYEHFSLLVVTELGPRPLQDAGLNQLKKYLGSARYPVRRSPSLERLGLSARLADHPHKSVRRACASSSTFKSCSTPVLEEQHL